MTLDEARAMVRAAYEANRRGDHAQAVQLATQVMDEMGNVKVYWPGEGAKHPAPQADIYDWESFARAQVEAARKTGAEVVVIISGATPASELLEGYFGLGDWQRTADMAARIIGEKPDADVAWMRLRAAARHMREADSTLRPMVVVAEHRGRFVWGKGEYPGAAWLELRSLAEVSEGAVSWDQVARVATLLIGGHTWMFTPGSQRVVMDGRPGAVPDVPLLQAGRVWVSVAALVASGFRRLGFPDDLVVVIQAPH